MNGQGEFLFEIHADPASGVIDMLAGPTDDSLLCFPARVVATPAGGSAFTFTMFQAPGQPDEQFETQHASLLRELKNLRATLRLADLEGAMPVAGSSRPATGHLKPTDR